MYGVFVNENGCVPYAKAIVQAIKPIETRNKNMLSALVGKRVAIVRTKRGKRPTIVGYVNIDSASFETAAWLNAHRDLTLIPEGSSYDAVSRGKWCYHLSGAETCEAYLLPETAIRHGRSFCEF